MLYYLRSLAELSALVKSSRRVVVVCYADWCPASSEAKPVFEHLAASNTEDIKFAKVRTDVSPEIAIALQVVAIPTFYAFYQGVLVSIKRGATATPVLLSWIQESFTSQEENALPAS